MFSLIVEQLNKDLGHIENLSITDKMIGTNKEGSEIFQGEGKYGPYVKIMEGDKWKYAPLKEEGDITVEEAIKLLQFPVYLGKYDKAKVYLHKGQYGLYLKYANNTVSIKEEGKNEDNIDIKYAKTLIESGDPYALKSFKLKDNDLNKHSINKLKYLTINATALYFVYILYKTKYKHIYI